MQPGPACCALQSPVCLLRQVFSKQALDFQNKIVERAGLGDETYLPEGARSRLVQAADRARPPSLTDVHLQLHRQMRLCFVLLVKAFASHGQCQ